MADNLTQIGEVLGNINATIDINTSTILQESVNATNISTSGWMSIFILGLFAVTIFLFVLKYQSRFQIGDRMTIFLISTNILLDIGFFLIKFNIVDNIQIIIFIFTSLYVGYMFSLLKKEVNSPSS